MHHLLRSKNMFIK
uniref:Uncharacterized protein n=1 Tax=Rhizophora mucronata TaxID=61149 RepID=A0A2P2NRI0_RHIMU